MRASVASARVGEGPHEPDVLLLLGRERAHRLDERGVLRVVGGQPVGAGGGLLLARLVVEEERVEVGEHGAGPAGRGRESESHARGVSRPGPLP